MLKRGQVVTAQEASYSEDELRRITKHAAAVFGQAERRIASNVAHLEQFLQGRFVEGSHEHQLGEVLRVVAETGDVPFRRWTARQLRHVPLEVSSVLGGSTSEYTWRRLYPNHVEIYAAAVLLIAQFGWNYTTTCELRVPTNLGDPSAPIYSVQLEKRRRGAAQRYETTSLVDDGPRSAGRLISRVIAFTGPARRLRALLGNPTDRLLLHRNHQARAGDPQGVVLERSAESVPDAWVKALGGQVNFRRLRRTVVVNQRQPNQHGRDLHDSVYVLRDPATPPQVEHIVAEGVERVRRQAEAVRAAISSADEQMPDTATVGCRDGLASPFTPHGVPCRASFLLCLACTNAVVMPRHLGRLGLLHEILTELRGTLPPQEWSSEWAEHYHRLRDLRQNHYTEGQWQTALADLSGSDRQLVEALMSGVLDR
jgi:hypothetical protein